MHTNYYFLRQLAPVLEQRLIPETDAGLRFMECFSQDRDEVVLVFAQAKGRLNYYKPFYIKATLRPDFSGLFFPDAVQRARTNSADLFTELTDWTPAEAPDGDGQPAGLIVTGVRSFRNERCLGITLEQGYTLVFKFFGNRPNLLVFRGNTINERFNQNLLTDEHLLLDQFDRPLDQSYESYQRAGYDHRPLFPTFGKLVNDWLSEHAIPGNDQWPVIQEVLHQFDHPTYYLTRLHHKPVLSLLPVGENQQVWSDPIEAANRFYTTYNGRSTFDREKSELLRLLEKQRKRATALIDINMERLLSREEGASHEEMGHILMANLHDIAETPGGRSPERVTLLDFYRDQPITLKLKPDLSPQRNAENFYRKAKNEKLEEEHLTSQVAAREQEIARIDQHLLAVPELQTLKEFRRYVKQHGLLTASGLSLGDDSKGPLFKEVTLSGFRILIGRNARNNDLLTQKFSYKEDLWLHARDVTGSHVLIKYQAGKTFPKNVIERAAELAAWYSKRRTDSLCPVTVTPKKFVRKPKGLAEGQVLIEKESVVMVVPKGE
ncbi:NFACT RNA binding domain-containing protein [Spirosoma sp. KUDC1026]|uniref:NFACT RNA binding domain-containing protein n=1 Tax=Spirosoma sp. KUDC1026 TaxID=2745947 RepID=UPI00159B9599|nr:NFACT RNA binding domain-containing protein [Spirosoma sp. KUDC1026]QKZ14611.1 fibronectin/fibrinogen-binding protein [Spirosoma sp. KUDC1026]